MSNREHSRVSALDAYETTNASKSSMFEVLEATDDDVVAIRVGRCAPAGFRELYDLLAEKTEEYGSVHLYEEAPSWTLWTFLSNGYGIVPDLRYGSSFDIDRYAAVGDSGWAKGLYYLWKAVAPVWPVSPEEMRYFGFDERERALEWVRTGIRRPDE